jgi:hypothetical protein
MWWAMVLEPTPPLAPTKGLDPPHRGGLGVAEQIADGLDDLQLVQRRHHVFADPLAHQFAIEDHVVDMADDDHLAGRVADRRQRGEVGQQAIALLLGFHQQHVGRAAGFEGLRGGGHAAHLDVDMGTGHAAVGGHGPHHLGHVLAFAEGRNVDVRDHRYDRRRPGRCVGGLLEGWIARHLLIAPQITELRR